MIGWLGRRRSSAALSLLQSSAWRCGQCGNDHCGMFDIACHAPDYWDGEHDRESNNAVRLTSDFLSEDFCILGGEHFFVRCVFEIPVNGMADKFAYGIWSTLSRANFERYIAGFDSGKPDDLGPWWGWFGNRLPGWPDTLNTGCWVHLHPGRQRPSVRLDDPEHELSIAQIQGISAERLLEIYAAAGHAPAPAR